MVRFRLIRTEKGGLKWPERTYSTIVYRSVISVREYLIVSYKASQEIS
jgi:hypothetical protein